MTTELPRSKALEHYLRGWPILGVFVITIWSAFWIFDVVEYALINSVYGTDAWDHGLRVVDKNGRLSDGRELSRLHTVVLNYGSFLLSVPFFLGSAFGLAYLKLRLHGKRLHDFPTKEEDAPSHR